MYHPLYPESRECPGCHFNRVPDARVVKRGKKHWIIFKCRNCGIQDIDDYTPKKVWNGRSFADEHFDDQEDEKD